MTLFGTLVLVAGIVLGLSGAGTWARVQTSLAGEGSTVAEDASWLAGDEVNGPFTAYAEVDISFGIAAMAMGLGVVFALVGFALRAISKSATV